MAGAQFIFMCFMCFMFVSFAHVMAVISGVHFHFHFSVDMMMDFDGWHASETG